MESDARCTFFLEPYKKYYIIFLISLEMISETIKTINLNFGFSKNSSANYENFSNSSTASKSSYTVYFFADYMKK